MRFYFTLISIFLFFHHSFSQDYTSYFTGDTSDVTTSPQGGVCIMGGATENDNAMRWFLERADGGDILVIRASGSDGYNDYFFSELGLTVNSVETIVFHDKQASFDDYVLQQVMNAEAIWIAGGNQWNYVDFWRDTPLAFHINQNIDNKNMVIGGTSAGMAIMGGIYYTAEFNSLQTADALANPFHVDLTLSQSPFIQAPFMQHVITDTHYDDPDRRGRHVVFLARAMKDWGVDAKGIACDEYTSVCIDTDGRAYAYGEAPQFDDNVYFLQINCIAPNEPETCEENTPLNWVRNNAAIKVYHIEAENSGSKYLDLNNWEDGTGGVWENWYIDNGSLNFDSGDAADCNPSSTVDFLWEKIALSPNPLTDGFLTIESAESILDGVEIYDAFGKLIFEENKKQYIYKVDFTAFPSGVYFVRLFAGGRFFTKKIIKSF